jgi:hypothetical protein
MAQRRPDLFHAYVGTGQIADVARNEAESYPLAVQRARASGRTKAARELEKIGPPPYPAARTWLAKQRWSFESDPELRAWGKQSLRMVLSAPDMSLRDIYLFNAAFTFYPQRLYEETMSWNARRHGTRFSVPFSSFTVTPTSTRSPAWPRNTSPPSRRPARNWPSCPAVIVPCSCSPRRSWPNCAPGWARSPRPPKTSTS